MLVGYKPLFFFFFIQNELHVKSLSVLVYCGGFSDVRCGEVFSPLTLKTYSHNIYPITSYFINQLRNPSVMQRLTTR